MIKHLLLAVAAGATIAAAGPAFAAQSTPLPGTVSYAQRCQGLEAEFDRNEPFARMNANLADAESMRGEGARLCASGHQLRGVAALSIALDELGLSPLTGPDPLEDRAG